VLVGLILAGLALAVAPRLAAWMAPVLIGLVFAPLLISWTASAPAGAWVAARGLLTLPEPRG
jgi:membrane glycosyltransferase